METEASRAAWNAGVSVEVSVGCSVVEWREVRDWCWVEGANAVVEVRTRRMGAREENFMVIYNWL